MLKRPHYVAYVALLRSFNAFWMSMIILLSCSNLEKLWFLQFPLVIVPDSHQIRSFLLVRKHLNFFVLLLQVDNLASTGPPVLSLFSYAASPSLLTKQQKLTHILGAHLFQR